MKSSTYLLNTAILNLGSASLGNFGGKLSHTILPPLLSNIFFLSFSGCPCQMSIPASIIAGKQHIELAAAMQLNCYDVFVRAVNTAPLRQPLFYLEWYQDVQCTGRLHILLFICKRVLNHIVCNIGKGSAAIELRIRHLQVILLLKSNREINNIHGLGVQIVFEIGSGAELIWRHVKHAYCIFNEQCDNFFAYRYYSVSSFLD